MSRISIRVGAGPLALFLLIIGASWKLTLTRQYTWANQPDFVNQVLPWFQFQAREWHRGQAPLWDPFHWAGQSLIGQGQPGVVSPLNWMLFLTPMRRGYITITALNWHLVLLRLVAGLLCYWLCVDLGRSRAAAVIAATAFAVSGWVGTTDWPQMLNGAMWGPGVFLFLFRAVRGDRPARDAALAGGFLGLSWLSGHHQIPTYLALAVALLLAHSLVSGVHSRPRTLSIAAALGLFSFLLSAAQLLPAIEYWKDSLRWVGAREAVGWGDVVPYEIHARYSLNPVSILGIVVPGIHLHSNSFIGSVMLALAIVGTTAVWRDRHVRVLVAIALSGLVFSLGGANVLHGLLYCLVPGLEKSRSPSAAIYLFHLGITVLAAFGLDALRRPAIRQGALVKRLCIALCAGGAGLYVVLLGVFFLQGDKVYYHARPGMAAFVAAALGCVLVAWRRKAIGSRAAVTIVGALALLDAGNVAGYNYYSQEQGWHLLQKLYDNRDIVAFLRRQPEPVRIRVDRDEIPFNFGDWHGIEQLDGYAGVTRNIFRLHANETAQMLLGQNYWIARKPERDRHVQVFEGSSGLRIYRDPQAFPRAWAVHEVMALRDEGEIPQHLTSSDELRRRAFVVGVTPKLESCEGRDEVDVIAREANRVTLAAQVGCRALVVLSDCFARGWEARVDGKSTPILEVYGALRGVVVEGGNHRIEMRYRPWSVYVGAALTGIGFVLLVGWVSLATGAAEP